MRILAGADAFAVWDTASFADLLGHSTAGAKVEHDRLAFVFRPSEQVPGDQRGHQVRPDRLAFLVHESAAIGITVEADAQVGRFGNDFIAQSSEICTCLGVGFMDEGAVGLEEQRDDLKLGQAVEDGGDHPASHAVGRIDHNAHLAFEVEEPQDMLAIGGPEILLLERALLAGLADTEGIGDAFDIFQAGGGADQAGLGAGNIEPIPADGAVRGSNLDAAGCSQGG